MYVLILATIAAVCSNIALATFEDKYYFAKSNKGPHIIRHSLLRQTFKLGYTLKLYCEAEAEHSVHIRWYKSGLELSSDHRTLIRTDYFPRGVASRLQIVLTRILDAGLYECVAQDENGVHMREFRIDYTF